MLKKEKQLKNKRSNWISFKTHSILVKLPIVNKSKPRTLKINYTQVFTLNLYLYRCTGFYMKKAFMEKWRKTSVYHSIFISIQKTGPLSLIFATICSLNISQSIFSATQSLISSLNHSHSLLAKYFYARFHWSFSYSMF